MTTPKIVLIDATADRAPVLDQPRTDRRVQGAPQRRTWTLHEAGPMSAGGDSGALVLDMQLQAVGLLFAGSPATTLINPIQSVLDALHVDIMTSA